MPPRYASARNEAAEKHRRLKLAIQRGRFEGELHGPPVIGPLFGMVRAYLRTVYTLFKEDLTV